VERVQAALVARVPEERLLEASGRIARVAAWARPTGGAPDRAAAADAARRALALVGDTKFTSRPRIVELRPVANIAAGEAEHSLAAEIVREGEPVPEADVYVVRDAHRHPWMQVAADVEGAVVVETGLPLWRPSRARGYVVTYGGSRASYQAVDDLLSEGVPV